MVALPSADQNYSEGGRPGQGRDRLEEAGGAPSELLANDGCMRPGAGRGMAEDRRRVPPPDRWRRALVAARASGTGDPARALAGRQVFPSLCGARLSGAPRGLGRSKKRREHFRKNATEG